MKRRLEGAGTTETGGLVSLTDSAVKMKVCDSFLTPPPTRGNVDVHVFQIWKWRQRGLVNCSLSLYVRDVQAFTTPCFLLLGMGLQQRGAMSSQLQVPLPGQSEVPPDRGLYNKDAEG